MTTPPNPITLHDPQTLEGSSSVLQYRTELFLVRPHRGGWEVYESEGVRPFFEQCELAINYAKSRTAKRRGEIRVLNSDGAIEQTIPFDDRFKRD